MPRQPLHPHAQVKEQINAVIAALTEDVSVPTTFGSWNEAIVAAGLIPLPQGGIPKADQRRIERLSTRENRLPQQPSNDEALDELVRVARMIGRRPSGNQITAKGKYSQDLYRKRWGSIQRAYEVALQRSTRP